VRSDGLDDDIDHAWSILEQARESGRLDPRPVVPQRMRDAESFGAILGHLAQAVAEIRSMARTIGLAQRPPALWPADFRDPWRELVGRAGIAVRADDAAAVGEVRSRLERLADELDLALLPNGFWPISGALIANLRNILQALDGRRRDPGADLVARAFQPAGRVSATDPSPTIDQTAPSTGPCGVCVSVQPPGASAIDGSGQYGRSTGTRPRRSREGTLS
jgi:hypothetical protein